MPDPVWIDCDPGLDDAVALMVLAARRDRFSLRGISTVAGNRPVEMTFRNARRLAAWLGLDVPVAKGAAAPLSGRPLSAGDTHGEDGLAGMRAGDVLLPGDARDAVTLLGKSFLASDKPVTVFATGPLTNLALLFRRFPAAKEKIRRLTIMGGSLSGGNVTPYAEFNFAADPPAAEEVLHAGVPVVLLGLDVTHQAYLTDEELRRFASLGTKHGDMVGDLLRSYAVTYRKRGFPGTPVHDASAVLYEADPSLFPGAEALHITVTAEGERAGECTVDPSLSPNVRFITAVDRPAFVRTLSDCCTS